MSIWSKIFPKREQHEVAKPDLFKTWLKAHEGEVGVHERSENNFAINDTPFGFVIMPPSYPVTLTQIEQTFPPSEPKHKAVLEIMNQYEAYLVEECGLTKEEVGKDYLHWKNGSQTIG